MASTQNSINNTFACANLTGTIGTTQIANNAVTYAKMQQASTVTLLGNPTGGAANISEITLGSGLSFSGSTLVSTGSYAPMPTTVNTSGAQAAVANNCYVANKSTLVTITLPATMAVGDEIIIMGLGVGGWSLAQNASQLVNFGNVASTTGTGGSIASGNQFDSLHIKCAAANTTWNVISSQGNLTVT